MKRIGWFLIVDLAVCVALTAVAYLYLWKGGTSFWANFILNVVSEFVGIGLTAAAAAFIAIKFTERKLSSAIGL